MRPSPNATWTRRTQTRSSGMDCFYVGRLSGTKGGVWQYTANRRALGLHVAELATSDRNAREPHASRLAGRVADELASQGWRLRAVSTDNGSEFRHDRFPRTITSVGAAHRLPVRVNRPTTVPWSACTARSSRSAGYPRSLARSCPSSPRCKDLGADLDYYNYDRAHTGRHTNGTPAEVIGAR